MEPIDSNEKKNSQMDDGASTVNIPCNVTGCRNN